MLISININLGLVSFFSISWSCFLLTVRVFQFTLDSRSEKLDWLIKSTYVAAKTRSCYFFDDATSFDSAVHRVHAVSFDAAVASTVSAACCVAVGYIVSPVIPADNVPAGSSSSIPAEYVSAGHVLV
ncbi:hypothetical protein Tco_0198583, partial [Tanacetum coccineum]